MLITSQTLAKIIGITVPKAKLELHKDLAYELTLQLPDYGIDTVQEVAHFLAQAAHETDHFMTLREYASGQAYEGRKDLGNTQVGDGVRFKGRGIFQTTGRANYSVLGIAKGQPRRYLDEPGLLEHPDEAVWSACKYWSDRHLNDIANNPDTVKLNKKVRGVVKQVSPVEYISLTINGGYNGYNERVKFYERAKEVLKA
jgi:putative chitinase